MKRNTSHRPPFVYFGGKSPVAHILWEAFGDPQNYVEPFCGSAAVLLLRENPGRLETINDADGFVSNVWRAIRGDVEAVAEYADEIVDECTLHARHLWLLGQREALTERLCGDPDYFDAKAAGFWLWGINCWIGSGWCSGRGPWVVEDGRMVLGAGQGVNRKLPHLGDSGTGVNRQRPHLGDSGTGECAERREWLIGYLQGFADRLRNVRICCGDWQRVCGPSVTYKHGPTAVFLDPPYADTATRAEDLCAIDCEQVAHRVREWAIKEGDNPLLRIAIAGYQDEHAMPANWRCHEWKAVGGYGLQGDDEETAGRANRKRERLWFSPHCLRPKQSGLFE